MHSSSPATHATPSSESTPVAAIILTILAAVWLLLGSVLVSGETTVVTEGVHPHSDVGDFRVMGWMWHRSVMDHAGVIPSWIWLNVIGGVILLFAAGALYLQPERQATWAIVIIIVSGIALFIGMGGIFAAILGILGGILALFQRTGPV